MIGVTNRRIIMQEIITLLCNCRFLQEVLFTYALAINVLRRGVRRNNSDAFLCGRLKFSPLFLRSKQNQLSIEMEMYDLVMRHTAPDDVKVFLRNNESLTRK